jgi:diguanylate cyclase (GGDEF)-like protein
VLNCAVIHCIKEKRVATSPDFQQASQHMLIHELSVELAKLDLSVPAKLGDAIVSVVASVLETDRVSLLLLKPGCCQVEAVHACGLPAGVADWHESQLIVENVIKSREPLFLYDIRTEPQLLSPWPDNYRTDACAVLPIMIQRQVQALLCISNLSAQQIIQIENAGLDFSLVQHQLLQLVQLLRQPAQPDTPPNLSVDELTVMSSLLDALERGIDSRDVFSVFCDVIGDFLPVDMLAVIHDCVRDPQQGIICVQRPVHRQEVSQVFTQLAFQWQRRHKRALLLETDDAHVAGGELIQEAGECPPELMLGQIETFPVFIDNDLFALVALATDQERMADRRRLKVFNLLISHLMLHVKKNLLLAQNLDMQTLDSLTGLYNERHFYQMMEREFDRAARYSVPLSLLFVDVDHFKDVNETYGFEAGDLLLKEISRIVMENMRSTDFCSRYSGERFVVVLPETHCKNSEIMANRLRRFIENHSFFIPNTNVFIKVTVSVGVASYLDHRPASLAQFIEFADTALYFAKRIGRNQVVGYSYVTNLMMKDTEHQS